MASDMRFVGAWELVSYVSEIADGATLHPLGSNPRGLIALDASGAFSVQIEPAADAPEGSPPYIAFFGNWSFNPAPGELVLVAVGALNRQLHGTVQRRPYRFEEGGVLSLYPPPTPGGDVVRTTVTWRRIEI